MSTNQPSDLHLAPRERAVLCGLAEGLSLADVARALEISESATSSYLRSARRRLYQVSETPPAIAIAYAFRAIAPPPRQDPAELSFPREQRYLVPLISQGLTASQVSRTLSLPLDNTQQEFREALESVSARNRVHFVARAWAYGLLTAEHVATWLRRAEVTRQIATVLDQKTIGHTPPSYQATASVITDFITYGRNALAELESLCRGLPGDSPAAQTAQFTLAEAQRRLHLPPPRPTLEAAIKRAQNLARLITALHAAIDRARAEMASSP